MKLLLIVLGSILCFSLSAASAQSLAWRRAGRLNMGINLSWLEASWTQGHTRPVPDQLGASRISSKKGQLALMHQLGFTTLRLPVRFDQWAEQKPPYRIKDSYFKAIDSIVQWAKLYDLRLIMDDHHGSLDDSVGWQQALPRVKAIWRQIASRYKNSDPAWVFFELYNEPHNISDAAWKQCALQLIKTVREIAPHHTLIVGGAQWNSISGMQKLGKLPDDNIIYTFHFYAPFLFTHQGAPWAGVKATANVHIPFPYRRQAMPPLNPKSKGTYGERNFENYKRDGTAAALRKKLTVAKAFSDQYGVPVFCGEWGSYQKYADDDGRCRYTAVIKNALETLDLPFAYWEWNQGFSFFNGQPALAHLSEGMKKAWGFK